MRELRAIRHALLTEPRYRVEQKLMCGNVIGGGPRGSRLRIEVPAGD